MKFTATILLAFLLLVPTITAYEGAWYKLNFLTAQQAEGFTWVTKGLNDLDENKYTRLNVAVTNVGSAGGHMRVEAGIYQRSLIQSWYSTPVFALVSPVNNCVPSETNVDTVDVVLGAGESTVLELTVLSPKVSGDTVDYGLHLQTFAQCYSEVQNSGGNVGMTDVKLYPITLRECGLICFGPSVSCTDSEVNGLETDLNCGGDECTPCSLNQRCKTTIDCQSGLQCSAGFGGENRCQKEAVIIPTVPVSPPVSSCGNHREDAGETCVNCPSDVSNCPEKGSNFGTYLLIIGAVVLLVLLVRRFK